MSKKKTDKRNMTEAEKKKSRKTGFYYSFLTVVLVFCFLQIGYGAILNISKIVSYQGKMHTLEKVLEQTKLRNEDLKAERKMITSDNSLEGIARNNLKMAGKDEVLIIINKKVEKPVKKHSKFKGFNFDFLKRRHEEDVKPLDQQPYIPQGFDEE